MVLLVVYTQKAITNSDLYQFELFEANVKKLIHKACQSNIEVIFVRHDDGVGNELTKSFEKALELIRMKPVCMDVPVDFYRDFTE